MKLKTALLLTSITFTCGLLTFAYLNQWFSIIIGPLRTECLPQEHTVQGNRNITISYWHNDAWQQERWVIPWSSRMQDTATYLINRYLELLYDEGILEKQISVQTVMFSITEAECYISFEKNPLNPQWSTFQKWHFMEGLLKTLRENGLSASKVYFLVNHALLADDHLNFTNPWPLNGFARV